MAIVDITKPMALDETLQGTNTKMDAVIQKLQGIIDALGLDTSVYKPKGNITCAELVPALLIDDNLGNVYNVTDNGTTTSDFVEGAGKPIHVGDNVAIVDIGTGGQSEYKFDLLAGMVDLTNYVQKSQTAGLLKNDGTVDTKDYAEKVAGATSGNLAGLNGSGNLTDSGWNGAKDTTSISGNPISISGLKADQLAINPIITLEPIQAGSGTPSPSNIRAISGYDKIEVLSCGKNLLRNEKYDLGGGSVLIGTSTSSASDHNYTLKSGTYTFSITTTKGMTIYYGANGGSGVAMQSLPFTFTVAEKSQYRFWAFGSGVTASDIVSFQLEENSSATTYVPYVKTTSISESLGQTVYYSHYDVRTGNLPNEGDAVDLGDLSWTYWSGGAIFYATLSNYKKESGCKALCEGYDYVGTVGGANLTVNNTCALLVDSSANYRIYVKDTRYTDATTFKTAVAGIKFAYEKATPTPIQLTPHEISLLKDYAYLSTNGTSIALDYHNGELASLADVSQLGETLNALGDSLKNVDVKVYYSGSNENWKIYRIGRIRILTAWNCPVGKMLTYVDDIDKPIEVYDSAMILIDSRMARFRIQADGGIGCQYIYSYGGSASSYTTSSTEKVFTSFAYVAKE